MHPGQRGRGRGQLGGDRRQRRLQGQGHRHRKTLLYKLFDERSALMQSRRYLGPDKSLEKFSKIPDQHERPEKS